MWKASVDHDGTQLGGSSLDSWLTPMVCAQGGQSSCDGLRDSVTHGVQATRRPREPPPGMLEGRSRARVHTRGPGGLRGAPDGHGQPHPAGLGLHKGMRLSLGSGVTLRVCLGPGQLTTDTVGRGGTRDRWDLQQACPHAPSPGLAAHPQRGLPGSVAAAVVGGLEQTP